MTALKRLYLTAVLVAGLGYGTWAWAEDDVTVISTDGLATTHSVGPVATDGTPVVHKSLHKKKHSKAEKTAKTSAAPSNAATASASGSAAVPQHETGKTTAPLHPQSAPASATAQISPVSPAKSEPVGGSVVVAGPTVETGLPVARYSGTQNPLGIVPRAPLTGVVPASTPPTGNFSRTPLYASSIPPTLPTSPPLTGSYYSPGRGAGASSNFVFTDGGRKTKNFYPWKTGIITTMFWIGEGSTPISSTTNEASSWDEDWLPENHGSDSPYHRSGYAAGGHASTLNPFYVALPFNDLAFPDKAREWLPRGWYRRPRDGKQVSACKDRWVEIKNAQGRTCYAQWEDVGPLRYDQAEYVFGDERPIGLGSDHAGLDVSPAVAQFLNINDRNRITSWRFVDDDDVKPGQWLILDEEAVLYTALHQKNTNPPIQRAAEPIDDPSSADSNKKKIDASRG